MKLASVREGDIVRVDDGMPYFALVLEVGRRELAVRPLYGAELHRRRVPAGDVVDHWRQSRASSARAPRRAAA